MNCTHLTRREANECPTCRKARSCCHGININVRCAKGQRENLPCRKPGETYWEGDVVRRAHDGSYAIEGDDNRAYHDRADAWVPGGGGTETPFTHNGTRWLYVWNHARMEHGYLNLDTDIVYDDYDPSQ